MRLQELINEKFDSVDLEGIGRIMLLGELESHEILQESDDKIVIKIRYVDYNEPLTHPALRNPQTDGYFKLTFVNEGDGWWFYDFA